MHMAEILFENSLKYFFRKYFFEFINRKSGQNGTYQDAKVAAQLLNLN